MGLRQFQRGEEKIATHINYQAYRIKASPLTVCAGCALLPLRLATAVSIWVPQTSIYLCLRSGGFSFPYLLFPAAYIANHIEKCIYKEYDDSCEYTNDEYINMSACGGCTLKFLKEQFEGCSDEFIEALVTRPIADHHAELRRRHGAAYHS